MTRATVLAIGSACALVAGCGQPTQEDQVRAVLGTFVTAAQKKDYKTLCSRTLSEALLAKLGEVNIPCEIAMREGLGAVRSPKLTVGRVRVSDDGRTASAEVQTSASGQTPSEDIVQLAREGDDWRISSLAGASPPAPAPTFAP